MLRDVVRKGAGVASFDRRGLMQLIGASAVVLALPVSAGGDETSFPDDELHAYARAVGADPKVIELGRQAMRGRDATALERSLRVRVPGMRDEEGWKEGLLAAAREDLANGHWIYLMDRRTLRVEADFFALAACLRSAVAV